MTKELKTTLIGALVGALLTGAVSLYIYYDGKHGIETKTVETLAKYFDSVDKEMSYNQALEAVYNDTQNMKSEIADLKSGKIDGILIESAQDFANSNNYITALSILNSVETKSPKIDALINDYTQKYENSVMKEVESLEKEDNFDKAKKVLEDGLKIASNSKVLKNKQQELNKVHSQNMVEKVPAYQSGGNEYKEYNANKTGATEYFTMGGVKYTNGMTFNADINIFDDVSWAVYKLDGKYSNLSFTVCHVDDTDLGDKTTLQVLYDGNLKKEISLAPDMYPKKVTLDISGVKQLKLQVPSSGGDGPVYGVGNPIIQ